MTEEEINIEEESEKKKRLPLKWIIIAVTSIMIIGGGILGFFIFKDSQKGKSKKASVSVSSKKPAIQKQAFGQIFPLESFVVNLNDPGGKRYLKTTIQLESVKSGFPEELDARRPQLRDTILITLSSKSIEQIQSLEGKISLRKELISKINQIMKNTKIRNLYFTEFVIQ